jgi:hypothetical protein
MPEIGKRYRLKQLVEGRDMFAGHNTDLIPGLEGDVIAIVPAAEDGAGDREHDCAVIQFDNGRTWSHPIEAVQVSLRLGHRVTALRAPSPTSTVTEDDHQLAETAPEVGWDDLFEEVN